MATTPETAITEPITARREGLVFSNTKDIIITARGVVATMESTIALGESRKPHW
jgi:hypothetical protein